VLIFIVLQTVGIVTAYEVYAHKHVMN